MWCVQGGETSAGLSFNFSRRVCLEPTISPEINRGVMHAVEGAWPVSVESQWLAVFGVVGRPLNTPPQCALFHRRSRNRFCAETVNKTADWPRSRIVQQTDWPRCIRIDMQEWPPCRGDTWCCVVETLLADSAYGSKYTCKVGFRSGLYLLLLLPEK